MSFSWGPFGWVNLALDAAVVSVELAAAAWLLRRWPLRDSSARSELLLIAAGIVLGAAAWAPPVLLAGGILGFSAAARVAWTTATVTVPLVALWAVRRRGLLWPAALAAALIGAKYYGEVWEPENLDVQRVEIRLAGLKSPLKLVHLSDLQTDRFGPLQARARAAANAFSPDLVVFTGDVINHRSLAPAAAEYLKGFTHRRGKFFVSGDVDGDLTGLMTLGGFEILDGQARQLDGLGLLGVSVRDMGDRALIERLSARLKGPRLLLSHRPDAVFAAAEGAADLVIAGHTHGGQVCLPLFGPIVTLTRVSRTIAAGGLHSMGRLQILVSRGLGWEGHVAPRVRTFCRPHLLLVDLLPGD